MTMVRHLRSMNEIWFYFFDEGKVSKVYEIWMDKIHKRLYEFELELVFLHFLKSEEVHQHIFACINLYFNI